ncbi:MAG TPA: acetyl ornithine aminotransferase family protein [Gemmatimonadaceae bacterium]|jgi:4-aminobutyrate aminotransferase|nr:acetyl ornithine aminotransferase family protein [Gemmatimonadaceae bacterium]
MARDYPRIVTPPPGPKGRAIVDKDREWTSHCYIKEYPLVIARGSGAMVEDVDGNRFLDFMAGIAVASTGFSHPDVVRAVQEAASRFLHICGSDFYYDAMAALCERLAKLAPGPTKKRVFLTNSGTETTEAAIKLVRHATRRTAILAFHGAFHGRSTGAVSLTSSKARQHAGFGPLLPDVHHVPFAYRYRCRHCASLDTCTLACVSSIESELFTRHLDPADCAAIFVEPIQGEGGYVIPPNGFMRGLRELCDRHGILLVCDEVQSGVGRTGRMWACDHEGIEPDILLTAKGLGSGMPIGAMIARETIDRWKTGSHGSTFGGNPVCCAAALATLDLVERELMANAREQGERLIGAMRKLAGKYACIGDVRGRGLMIGLEFVKDRATREPDGELVHKLVETAFQRGLLLLGAGRSALRLAPPLIIDSTDVDTGVQIIDQCLAELTAA